MFSFFETGKIPREYLLNETKYFVLHFHITYILSFFFIKTRPLANGNGYFLTFLGTYG
ncbi:hypothetical protein EfmE1071_1435 [Enterococcus faecium E1071]|nr:hypothetical protein EfmE1071_1435 [Enterococcus faecium E1071]